MKYSWIMSFPIFLELVIYSYAHPPDYPEKTWMDRCDIKKMSIKPTVATTRKPTTKKIVPYFVGQEDFGVGTRFYKVNNFARIDVEAALQNLIKNVKDKLAIDAAERGTSLDLDNSAVDSRGFGDDYYEEHSDYDFESREENTRDAYAEMDQMYP